MLLRIGILSGVTTDCGGHRTGIGRAGTFPGTCIQLYEQSPAMCRAYLLWWSEAK